MGREAQVLRKEFGVQQCNTLLWRNTATGVCKMFAPRRKLCKKVYVMHQLHATCSSYMTTTPSQAVPDP